MRKSVVFNAGSYRRCPRVIYPRRDLSDLYPAVIYPVYHIVGGKYHKRFDMGVVIRCSLFRLLLKRLLPNASRDSETLAAISANLSADLLGLGNAATPLGIRAACRMSRGCKGTASDELCLLVVLNTASIQLLPTTLAGVRASLGAADPFDILPAVWLTSLLSVLAGLFAAKLLAHFWRN